MAITNNQNGFLTVIPTVMVASATPVSRLIKGIIVTNLDSIEHVLHLEVTNTLLKVLLKAGDSLHFNTTVSLGSDSLVGYVEESIGTTNPSYVVSYLDEAETI